MLATYLAIYMAIMAMSAQHFKCRAPSYAKHAELRLVAPVLYEARAKYQSYNGTFQFYALHDIAASVVYPCKVLK